MYEKERKEHLKRYVDSVGNLEFGLFQELDSMRIALLEKASFMTESINELVQGLEFSREDIGLLSLKQLDELLDHLTVAGEKLGAISAFATSIEAFPHNWEAEEDFDIGPVIKSGDSFNEKRRPLEITIKSEKPTGRHKKWDKEALEKMIDALEVSDDERRFK